MQYKLLTIAIPTYNRPEDLDRSLASVLPQIKKFEEHIEFIISDNASTKDNASVVAKYKHQGYAIEYIIQEKNLGMDGNFAFVYEYAKTKYVWMLSDDDILVDCGVELVIDCLSFSREVGSLYLGNIWYDGNDPNVDVRELMPKQKPSIVVYNNPLKYLERVNYWVTFLSANIVNKDLLKGKVDTKEFQGTFLALLGWIIPAIFQQAPNAVIEGNILICKANNTGGYKLFEVFSKNFNKVMSSLILKGYDKRMKDIINKALLENFFPSFINTENKSFSSEKSLIAMLPVFWKCKIFWTGTFPKLIKRF